MSKIGLQVMRLVAGVTLGVVSLWLFSIARSLEGFIWASTLTVGGALLLVTAVAFPDKSSPSMREFKSLLLSLGRSREETMHRSRVFWRLAWLVSLTSAIWLGLVVWSIRNGGVTPDHFTAVLAAAIGLGLTLSVSAAVMRVLASQKQE